jgi:alpha-tubulin suppressor-like RCC1 family protein
VAAGAYYALALRSDGTVWSWGDNSNGALGDGTTTSKLSPEPIGLVGVTQVVMGQNFLLQTYSAAIRYDGTLWTWGCNPFGQLGYGSVTYVVDYTCTNIGTVTWQSPAAGTRVNRGAAVSIRIGTAPRPPRECL